MTVGSPIRSTDCQWVLPAERDPGTATGRIFGMDISDIPDTKINMLIVMII
jgi:hypothetical protein